MLDADFESAKEESESEHADSQNLKWNLLYLNLQIQLLQLPLKLLKLFLQNLGEYWTRHNNGQVSLHHCLQQAFQHLFSGHLRSSEAGT